MSGNVKWALVIGSGLLTAAIVYVFTSDVVWSVIGLLGVISVGKAVAHPGSVG
jgi:hypothetical protein